MVGTGNNRWVWFLRNDGPIPTNDNMYDETIQYALRRFWARRHLSSTRPEFDRFGVLVF